jgi:hypothetical protein
MFTFANGNAGFKDIALSAPNGQFLDASGVIAGTLLFRFTRWVEMNDLGVLGHSNTAINNSFMVLHTGQGFQFNANVTAGRLNISTLTIASTTSATSTFLDLGTSTFSALSIMNVTFLNSTAGQTFLSGAAGGANITTGEIGFVSRVTIEGDMAALGTISELDSGWDFSDNNKTKNTVPHAVYSLDSGSVTTISAAGTPVQVNGAFTVSTEQIYTTSAAGTATYNGVRTKFVRIDITMSFEPESGTNKNLFVQIAVNGTVIPETKIVRTSSSGSAAVVSVDWAVVLNTTDSVSVFVGNDTDTTNVLVNQLLVRAS